MKLALNGCRIVFFFHQYDSLKMIVCQFHGKASFGMKLQCDTLGVLSLIIIIIFIISLFLFFTAPPALISSHVHLTFQLIKDECVPLSFYIYQALDFLCFMKAYNSTTQNIMFGVSEKNCTPGLNTILFLG